MPVDVDSRSTASSAEARGQPTVSFLAWLTVAGIAIYVALDVIVQVLPPHYSPIRQAESDLAVGPYSWIMTVNFVVRGILSAALLWMLVVALGLRDAPSS